MKSIAGDGMISFGGKKKVKTTVEKPKQSAGMSRAAQKHLRQVFRLLSAAKIGSRIRYHQEYEESTILESLVVGYRINKTFIFRQNDVVFDDDEHSPRLIVNTGKGQEDITVVEDLQLVVPGGIGEERKLDYDSRANLGRRGPFAPHSHLMVMSHSYNSEHLKFEAVVTRNQKLIEGVHSGLAVALLEVMLGTLDTHEPRRHSRVETSLVVTVCKNGKETVTTAYLLDFSEEAMRLALDTEGEEWPEFGKKDFLLVGLKTAPDKPLVKLRCECVATRGVDRVFRMTHILRHGKSAPFEMLDALEIKIDLMNLV
ncbi:PilZ domain-containing protein [Pseudomaricurvus alkylphenolicus]|uniref:PilZ domain-containing protein n=1 Tax=Pseudomaricurvus alkylphenolicus TaxID=1306991 RepID=UPI00142060C3|nr:PilZ domain-containing protein [Pseudomaricurvus alkylphenolicus]NIB41231.1 PilZ domain-containing protein [Pseudomaricurvus alkylphenolicus]